MSLRDDIADDLVADGDGPDEVQPLPDAITRHTAQDDPIDGKVVEFRWAPERAWLRMDVAHAVEVDDAR